MRPRPPFATFFLESIKWIQLRITLGAKDLVHHLLRLERRAVGQTKGDSDLTLGAIRLRQGYGELRLERLKSANEIRTFSCAG
jgi:hypothetical protein